MIAKYREYFKEDILAEDPDMLWFNDMEGVWNMEGASTFGIYKDNITSGEEWVGVQYDNMTFKGIKSSNNDIVTELEILYNRTNDYDGLADVAYERINKMWIETNVDKVRDDIIEWVKDHSYGSKPFTHGSIGSALQTIGRLSHPDKYIDRGSYECVGRLFNIQGDEETVRIFSIWNDNSIMFKYKNVIFAYLKSLGLNPTFIRYQTSDDDDKISHNFNDMFKPKAVEPNALDTYKKREADWKAKQHAVAGMLPKGWKI